MLARTRGVAARPSVEMTLPLRVGALILVTKAGNGALTPGAATNSRLLVTASEMTTTPDGEAGTLFLTGTRGSPSPPRTLMAHSGMAESELQSEVFPAAARPARVSAHVTHPLPAPGPRAPLGTAAAIRVLRSASALNSGGCSLPRGQQTPILGRMHGC
ncbi:unnamed protein product [Coccothraustes coccothraustes]